MAISIIPFVSSIGHYDFDTAIDDVSYFFDVRWNEFEQAWYFDIYELDGMRVVALGLKVVTGTYIGRQLAGKHALFKNGVFAAIDTENENPVDPGFDDMGTRVELRYYPIPDLVAEVYAV